MLTRADLRVFQRFFVGKIKQCFHPDHVKRLPGVMLALEPGAGKTVTVLTALLDLLNGFVIRKVLIVAPLLVAQTVWPQEPDEWEHLTQLRHMMQLLRVEDDDPDVNAAGDAAYAEALARYQAEFELERQSEIMLGAAKGSARTKARANLKKSPGERAEPHRLEAIAAAKAAKLAALANTDAEIHIINKEGLDWLWAHFRKGRDWPYDVMVIDDCREGRSGKRRKKGDKNQPKKGPAPLSRWGIMAQARKRMMATIQLTGTPTPKGLQNMWGLIYLIDLGERLGAAKTHFLNRWFNIDRDRHLTIPHAHSFGEVMGRVKDIMFSLNPEDMPQLPPYIVDPIRVKLPATVLDRYKRFKRQMVSEEYDVEAVNGGVLHGKLLQFANGSMYREAGDDVWIHDVKIEALKLLVERLEGTPLLVAYTYQFDAERIMKAFPDAVLMRPENAVKVTRDWNADRIGLLLAHRASAGHGLNLQKGTGHMCEYGLTSDAELYLQFLKRLLRPGRRDPVFNHVIIAEGTIDDEVFPKYLDPKIAEQVRIMQAVQVSFGGDLVDILS